MHKSTVKLVSTFIALLMCVAIIGEISVSTARGAETNTPSNEKASATEYWTPVEKAMGENGNISSDGAISITIPVTVNVTMNGISLNPASERSHEFDFMKAGNKAIMVGQIGVTEEEVGNVSAMALQSGIQVTAIHNHLLHQSPNIMWIHVHGYDDPVVMAKKMRNIIDYVNGNSSSESENEKFKSQGINTTELDHIIGDEGSVEGGDYNFDIPRADKIEMDGYVLSPTMDISSTIQFQPLGGRNALVTGEFTLEANEVEPVIRTLTDNGIEVTAIHNHKLTEQPRLFYIHYWGTGDAAELAGTMREALDETNSKV